MKVIKNNGKRVFAYMLGSSHPVIDALIEDGRIIPHDDGTYEIMSLEAVNGSGQIARSGDYLKLDFSGNPYPNDREFFQKNHWHIEGDEYEQIPKPLLAWSIDEPVSKEVAFLILHKDLVLDLTSHDKFFTAPLWGTIESSPRDSVLVFYSVTRDDDGSIVDADFNFVARDVFEKTYSVIGE